MIYRGSHNTYFIADKESKSLGLKISDDNVVFQEAINEKKHLVETESFMVFTHNEKLIFEPKGLSEYKLMIVYGED